MSLRDPKIQRMLLAVGLCAVVGWGYFLSDLLPFGYRKTAKKEQELRATRETVATELEKARRTVGNLPQLEKEQKELDRKWKQAETLLPTDREMAELLTSITQAGDQAGVEFQTFKPDPPRPQEFYNENPVQIEVKGGFHQVGVFLARLANLPRIVNISGLTLDGTRQNSKQRGKRQPGTAPEDDHSDQTLTASFTATAYSLRDPTAPVEQAPPAERNGRRPVPVAVQGDVPEGVAPVAGGRSTPGGITKRLSDKVKKPTEGEQ